MQESFTEVPFRALMVAGAITSMPRAGGAAAGTGNKSRDVEELTWATNIHLPTPPCTGPAAQGSPWSPSGPPGCCAQPGEGFLGTTGGQPRRWHRPSVPTVPGCARADGTSAKF